MKHIFRSEEEVKNRERSTPAEYFIYGIIILNAVVIFLQEGGVRSYLLDALDIFCLVCFIVEMIIKLKEQGFVEYWRHKWNCLDGILVVVSIPSLILYFFPNNSLGLSILLIIRLFRAFRFARLLEFFKNVRSTKLGIKTGFQFSMPVMLAFLLLIVIVSLFNCALLKTVAPAHFGTPWDSLYSTFRMFTVEGWYEIPDSMASALTPGQIVGVRIYFIFLLMVGGIFGLSVVNSIFVDAMGAEKHGELERKIQSQKLEINNLSKKIDALIEEFRRMNNMKMN